MGIIGYDWVDDWADVRVHDRVGWADDWADDWANVPPENTSRVRGAAATGSARRRLYIAGPRRYS